MNFNYDNYPFKSEGYIELGRWRALYRDSYTGTPRDVYYGNADWDNVYGGQSIEYSYEYNSRRAHTYDSSSYPFQAYSNWGQGFNDTINVLKNGGTPASVPNGLTYDPLAG